MDWMTMLIYGLPTLLAGVGGTLFVGRLAKRKQRNDILQEMQNTIRMLVDENSKILGELVEVKKQNADLQVAVNDLKHENERLRKEVKKWMKE